MSNSNNINVTDLKLEEMEKSIFLSRPHLKTIKETYGELSYFDYVKKKNRVNLHKDFSERKNEVVDVITSETSRLLGSTVASEVKNQLKKNDSLSTAEHTAPLGTAQTLNAGLSQALSMFNNTDPRFFNVIVLSCTNTSFDNVLSFSRGFQVHTFTDEGIKDSNISFFSRSRDPQTVMYSTPYTANEIKEMRSKLENIRREANLSDEHKQILDKLVTSIFSNPHVMTGADYCDQLTIINYYLWKKLFPAFKDSQIPNYIMLSQEKILLNLLLKYHLKQVTSIHKFIFDSTYLDLIEKYFNGVTGSISTDKSSGTFLFWGYSKDDGMRFQLQRDGNSLVNKSKNYKLNLTPNDVERAILNKEIIPSLLLTFTVLSFYYGLILGGGPSQTSYLPEMKKKYIEMMKEVGDEKSATDANASITDDFILYRPHLAFLEHKGERVSATALDMYLYQDPANIKKVIEATKSIPLNNFISIMLPTLYKQFCPEDKKKEELVNISRQDVETFLGVDQKVPPLNII